MRNIRHPRHVTYEDQTTSFEHHPLCGTKTGWSHWNREGRKTDLKEYGVGIVLYYQFLKYLQIMMLLFTIMNIPTLWLFYHGTVTTRNVQEGNATNFVNNESIQAEGSSADTTESQQEEEMTEEQKIEEGKRKIAEDDKKKVTLLSMITSLSMGNLGEKHDICKTHAFSIHDKKTAKLELICPNNAHLARIKAFGRVEEKSDPC
jgi:hypothetical protein